MIPCKQLKCLKFPICKNRAIINCDELKKYYNDMAESIESESIVDIANEVWIAVHQNLPSVSVINGKPFTPSILYSNIKVKDRLK